jgi:subtilisin family serine protease
MTGLTYYSTNPVAYRRPAVTAAGDGGPENFPALCRPQHDTMIHAASRTIRSDRAPFEVLENRRLLSASALDNPVVAMNWNGRQARAEAGEYILALSPGAKLVSGRAGHGQVRALRRALGQRGGSDLRVEEYLGRPGLFLLDVPQARSYEQVLSSVQSLGGFQYIEPNFVFTLEATPNDPLFSYEYGLDNSGATPMGASTADADIDAVEAWDVTPGSASVVVGVVDSGVDYTHPDLAANIWTNPFETAGNGIDDDGNGYVDDVHGMNALTGSGDPMDDNGHGTHAAGTIAAVGNNGVGVTGVAWNAQIMALKFLAADGSGSTADAIECLNYAASMRQKGVNIRLTSNSWGGGGYEQALKAAVANTGAAGMLFVAAAGNGGDDGVGDDNDAVASYPSNYDLPNVVSVAATDRNDALARFSNYGAATVDLAAPGVDIASTVPGATYGLMSGTSMATPHVSGVAALAWSRKPGANPAEVRGALLGGVDKVPSLAGKVATGGRLNALGTLNALGNSLSGVAYNDADGDGSRGGAEAALAGRTVFLDLNDNGVLDAAAGEPSRATGADGAYRFDPVAAGTYAVRQVVLSGWVGTAPATGYHTVHVLGGSSYAGRDFGSRMQAADPNDQIAEAYAMAVGMAAGGTVGDGGAGATDVDLFSFTVVAGQRVGFDVDAAAGSTLDSHLRVFNGAGAQLAANDNAVAPGEAAGVDSYVEYTFATAGTYYAAVSGSPNAAYDATTGAGDAAGSTGAFTLALVNRTVGNDVDDQLGEARALTVGTTASDSVSLGTDVDMYRFTVTAGQHVAFDIDRTGATAIVDSYLRVFNAAGRVLGYNDNGAAPGETLTPASYLEVTFPTAGTYFVGVSANPNRAYNPATGGTDVSGRGGTYLLTLNAVATTTAARTASTTRGVFSEVPVASTESLVARRPADVLELLTGQVV